jgi:hypothetical protein
MHDYVPRALEQDIERRLETTPVVAVLGPRQCGKSTLARQIAARRPGTVFLDLERPSDRSKLADPEAFFALHDRVLVCLDEVQRAPDLFPVLRSVVDERALPGQFLLLGSASPDLMRQSAETLAGRIAFLELTPFRLAEVGRGAPEKALSELWLRGGFPRSFLATDDDASEQWRVDFVRTFLEMDVAAIAPRIATERLERFWRMCAHLHGQLLNARQLGAALGVSGHTVRAYLELLQKTFMLRLLPPLHANLGKRLVKSPKVFIRDAGVLHALLGIPSHEALLGHPTRGASWEGLVIEEVIAAFPRWRASFVRTSNGAEMDLVLERGTRRLGFECKAASAPRPSRGFWDVVGAVGVEQAFVVAPIREAFPLGRHAAALPLGELVAWARRLDTGKRHPATAAR